MLKFLKNGAKIPQRIAIIMDGNRRYAQERLHADKHEGHKHGLQKLIDTMEWCLELGMKEVGVYALAINNLKRSKKELDTLFDLIKSSFQRFAKQREFFEKNGVKVNICGRLEMLPKDVQEPLFDVMEETKDNTNCTLHIYVCYSSTQEFIDGVYECKEEFKAKGTEYTQDLLDSKMYAPGFEPDILIRTSNENRLSNFFLFQSKNCQISYCKNYWPDFSLWDMLKIILEYQNKQEE
ncbi:unnamed protein product [Moneuplotes crassus]|uniref:Alkyl transferase n=1 Tax=Euplotes crassus TaxID=5936 RepID=A0AAD1XV31_EUPCR|nr:unnamed protein product [Moneuplotes crassus]